VIALGLALGVVLLASLAVCTVSVVRWIRRG
jgi:hypothetical protein